MYILGLLYASRILYKLYLIRGVVEETLYYGNVQKPGAANGIQNLVKPANTPQRNPEKFCDFYVSVIIILFISGLNYN